MQEEVLKEYKKMKHVSGDLSSVINLCLCSSCYVWGLILGVGVGVVQDSPNYHVEKQRCEYLHNKLAHIKRLIADFDQRRAQAWC